MAETADTITTTVSKPQAESDVSKRHLSDLTLEENLSDLTSEGSESEKKHGGNLFSVWPPCQQSRERVMKGMIKTLYTDSFISYKYGTLEPEEVSAIVKSSEEEAYDVASSVVSSGDALGIKKLDAYYKELSERILKRADDRLKAKKSDASPEF